MRIPNKKWERDGGKGNVIIFPKDIKSAHDWIALVSMIEEKLSCLKYNFLCEMFRKEK